MKQDFKKDKDAFYSREGKIVTALNTKREAKNLSVKLANVGG